MKKGRGLPLRTTLATTPLEPPFFSALRTPIPALEPKVAAPREALLTCGPWPHLRPGGEGHAEWTGSGAQVRRVASRGSPWQEPR